MTNGMPFCSATWAMAVVWPESNAPMRSCTIIDELLGALARDIDAGLGVGVDDCQFRQAQRFEDARCDIDATLTVLTDARFESGFRQQDTDLQGCVGAAALSADDSGRR